MYKKCFEDVEQEEKTYHITTYNRKYHNEKINEIEKDAEKMLSHLLPALTKFYKKHGDNIDFLKGLTYTRRRNFITLENGKTDHVDSYEMWIPLFMSRQFITLEDKTP